MREIVGIIGGIGILIALYLVVFNAGKTAQVVSAIGGTTSNTIKTLQGR